MAHAWVNLPSASTPDGVRWQCSQCPAVVAFARKGMGEPWASETELPADVDRYVDPCISDEQGDVLTRVIAEGIDLDKLLDKLVQAGKITLAEKDRIASKGKGR